jgi:ATP-binding cassette subfamily F protein 3
MVRARLGGFGFGEDKAFVPVAELSGGERARLNFALVTHDAPSLLVLDEPTNHLDLETREVLVQALNEFAGALVLVSHDWHLLELVADQLWLVADGTVRSFDGDLDDYRRLVLAQADCTNTNHSADTNERRIARQRAAENRRVLTPLRQEARRIEGRIAVLSREREEIERKLASLNGARLSGSMVSDTLKRHGELMRLIAQAEADWLATEEAIERGSDG